MKFSSFFNNIFVKNILLAIIVLFIIIFGVLWWLDIYTNHGKQVEIPDVRGLQLAEAAPFFKQRSLKYEVIDSTFVKNKTPGSILETSPPVGTKVKEKRTIFITLNAYSAQLLVIPTVKDMSQRQAVAMLKSLGFENVEVKMVHGVYKDLVLGLETTSTALEPGSRIPADAPLFLLVSSGDEEIFFDEEEIMPDSLLETEESWN